MAVTIRRLGWASIEVVSEQGTRVVLDPFLEADVQRGLPASPFTVADLASAHIVAVTHAGFDHLGQAIEITKAGKAMLLCGGAVRIHARRNAVSKDQLMVMGSGALFRFRDVRIKAVDARHLSFMKSKDDYLTDQPVSYFIFTDSGERVFYGGDTSINGDLKVFGELYRPQVAVLGIGGLALDTQPIVELPPDEAAIAADWLGVQHIIPVHYHAESPAEGELRAAVAQRRSPVRVNPLGWGEAVTFSAEGGLVPA